MTYKIFCAAVVFGLLSASAVFTISPARAAEVSACSITQTDVNVIRTIQNDPTLSYSAELAKELAARKDLLNRVIVCAQNEVKSLQQNIQAVSPVDGAAKNVQSGLIGQLNDAANYYGIEQGKLAGVGISGSQQIARDVLSWRAGSLLPLGARVSNFILWSKNQDLLSAAATRMAQAGRVVSFLSSTNNADLASAYSAAQASFKKAQDENAAAESALAQSQPADQIALLIQESLQSLADTYQSLSKVGDVVQSLVPQGQ